MPSWTKKLTVMYWPVGQGLFSTAEFTVGRRTFRMVYDCGAWGWSESGAGPPLWQISGKPIDLLVLSHFHWDHIAGVPRLFDASDGIRRAWVPYLAPRLRALFAASVAARGVAMGLAPSEYASLIALAAEPAGWLREHGVERVDEVGGPGDAEMGAPPDLPFPDLPRLEFPERWDQDELDGPESIELGSLVRWPEAFSARSSLRGTWAPLTIKGPPTEFALTLMTWVKPLTKGAIENLYSQAAQQIGGEAQQMLLHLLRSESEQMSAQQARELAEAIGRTKSRREVQRLYRMLQPELNSTSLFLMVQAARIQSVPLVTGLFPRRLPWSPVYPWAWPWRHHYPDSWDDISHPCPRCWERYVSCFRREWDVVWQLGHPSLQKLYPTVLWSGDATSDVLGEVAQAATEPLRIRMGATNLWQVPHHGARSSFAPGFYQVLGDCAALIGCGLRNRYHHPGSEVARHTNAEILTEESDPAVVGVAWR